MIPTSPADQPLTAEVNQIAVDTTKSIQQITNLDEMPWRCLNADTRSRAVERTVRRDFARGLVATGSTIARAVAQQVENNRHASSENRSL